MKTFLLVIVSIAIFSCAKRHFINESGSVRPVKKNVFSFSKKFKRVPDILDTNVVYVKRNLKFRSTTIVEYYEFMRFFPNGQILYSGASTNLDFSHVNDITWGIIGRYYFKSNQLRMQFFYPVSISKSMFKTYGFVENGNIYTFEDSPETWFGSYFLTKLSSKNDVSEWKKHEIPLKHDIVPPW